MKMKPIMPLVITSVLIGLVSFASAGTIRHDRDDQSYLDLGALYPQVGLVEFSTTSSAYIASGTLIDSEWVLTAAHVVDEATSLTFTVGGGTYSAVEWVPHPKWKGDLLAGYDIGLVNLGSAVADVAPAQRYTGSEELGKVGTAVGYGMTGTGLKGATTFDWQKRAGQNVIDVLYGQGRKKQRLFLCDFDNPDDPGDNAYGSSVPLDLESLVAPGDSGGGVFLDLGDGPLLAGVHSFIGAYDEALDSDYGDVSGHTRLSLFNSWIDKVISGDDGDKPGKGPPPWAGPKPKSTATPEPATMSLLILGGLALLKRKRKSYGIRRRRK